MEKINKPGAFATVDVYREGDSHFFIRFKNPEQSHAGVNFLAIILSVLAAFPIAYYGEQIAQATGLHWGVFPALAVLQLVAVFIWRWPGRKIPREIEIDMDNDRLRVRRRSRVTLDRKLSTLDNMTIEPHPKAVVENIQSGGKLGQYQKQHCLMGHFGVGGTERVPLLFRLEWPSRSSLLEVGEARKWAWNQAPAREWGGSLAPAEDDDEEALPQARRRSLKPPLD